MTLGGKNEKKSLLLIFVVGLILFSNYSLSYGAEEALRLPIFKSNRLVVTTLLDDLVNQIEL